MPGTLQKNDEFFKKTCFSCFPEQQYSPSGHSRVVFCAHIVLWDVSCSSAVSVCFAPFRYRTYIRRSNHDVARSVAAETGHHQLDGVAGPSAQRATDAHAHRAANGRRSRGRPAVGPRQVAVRAPRQPGHRRGNDGLDASVEILQAVVADRMLRAR